MRTSVCVVHDFGGRDHVIILRHAGHEYVVPMQGNYVSSGVEGSNANKSARHHLRMDEAAQVIHDRRETTKKGI